MAASEDSGSRVAALYPTRLSGGHRRRAGVRGRRRKRAVHNLFDTKDALFRAVVGWATDTAGQFVAEQIEAQGRTAGETGGAGVGDELGAFAVAHARAVLTPRVIAVRRLLIGESLRFPDLAAEYFERVERAALAGAAVFVRACAPRAVAEWEGRRSAPVGGVAGVRLSSRRPPRSAGRGTR